MKTSPKILLTKCCVLRQGWTPKHTCFEIFRRTSTSFTFVRKTSRSSCDFVCIRRISNSHVQHPPPSAAMHFEIDMDRRLRPCTAFDCSAKRACSLVALVTHSADLCSVAFRRVCLNNNSSSKNMLKFTANTKKLTCLLLH